METSINLLDGDFLGLNDDLNQFFNDYSAVDTNDDFNFAITPPKESLFQELDSDALLQTCIDAENVQSEHDYASRPPSEIPELTECDMQTQMSPTALSDSGISSSSPYSRSPTSSDTNSVSPVGFTYDDISSHPANSSPPSDSSSDTGFPLSDDLQFDFSDIDMENVANNFPMAGDDILDSCLKQSDISTRDDVLIQLDEDLFGSKNKQPQILVDSSRSCSKLNVQSKSNNKAICRNSNPILPFTIQDVAKEKTSSPYRCTLPNFKPLVLTDEELKLLAEENASLPTDLPLTKNEEKVLKRVRRKIRNKKSAMESRKRRKDYVGGLEDRVSKCTQHNQELVNKVKSLEQQNESLITQLKRLQEIVRTTSNKTTQATTCVMVLLLSFGLFLAPSYGPFSVKRDEHKLKELEEPSSVPEGHRTRRVLEHGGPPAKRPHLEIPVKIEQEVTGMNVEYPSVKMESFKSVHQTDIVHNNVINPPIKKENNASNNASKTVDNTKIQNPPIENGFNLKGDSGFSERPDSNIGLAPKSFQPIFEGGDGLISSNSAIIQAGVGLKKEPVRMVHILRQDEM